MYVCKTVVILNGCTKVYYLYIYIRVYRGGTHVPVACSRSLCTIIVSFFLKSHDESVWTTSSTGVYLCTTVRYPPV
jgi:hypothetical protein